MFIARWMAPMCRNVAVKRRHHWPPVVRGPKLAPQATRSVFLGSIGLTPRITMSAYTSTLAAMIPWVTKSLGVSKRTARPKSASAGE